MQVEQLAATGQGSCGIPSEQCKHFSYTMQNVMQEFKSYETRSHKSGCVFFSSKWRSKLKGK